MKSHVSLRLLIKSQTPQNKNVKLSNNISCGNKKDTVELVKLMSPNLNYIHLN